jgi:hypothetical protein
MKHAGPQVDSATSIFHNTIFKKSEGFDLKLYFAMDIDLWVQFIQQGIKYKRLNHFFYAFRIHQGSKTAKDGYNAKPSEEKLIQARYIIEKYKYKNSGIAIILSKIYKLIFCKSESLFRTLKWKGKSIYSL